MSFYRCGGGRKISVDDIEDILFNALGHNVSHTISNSPSSSSVSVDQTTGSLTSKTGAMTCTWGKITFLKAGHYIYFNTTSGVMEGDFEVGDTIPTASSGSDCTATFAMKIKD